VLKTINSATQCSVMLPPSVQSIIHADGVRLRFEKDDVRFELGRVRCGLPTSMEVICQVKARVSWARSGERANHQFQDVLRATVCLSASVPALGRTRHPFAVSGSEEPSQKIEFVLSASPETIRREPQEGDLLRSVGNMQDLAVCAFCSSC